MTRRGTLGAVSGSPIAPVAALAGGVLWLTHAAIGGSGPLTDTLYALGLVLILVAAAVFGSSLVKSDALALRIVVGLASGLLALSLIGAFRPGDSALYDAFWGVVAALLGGIALLRGRRRGPGRGEGRTTSGSHSR